MPDDISVTPLWFEDAALPPPAAEPPPRETDVLVVGAGYTGLSAARETAAAGRRTLVLDAGAMGTGCSSRNGGQVAYSIKPSFSSLKAKFGADAAFRICREGLDAVQYLRSLATQQIDCDWREDGCFFGAHTQRHFTKMVWDAEHQPRGLEQRIDVVSRAEQHRVAACIPTMPP
jgi:glycine/D-amino acid oxidase-like deaminating enzyme